MLTEAQWSERIVAMHEGEIYGERLFSALAVRDAGLPAAALWRRVAAIEQRTGGCVQALSLAYGATIAAQRERADTRVAEQLDAFTGQDAEDIARYYLGRVPDSVARLRSLAPSAPARERPVVAQFIAHSEAFVGACERWLDGDRRGALASLDNYLDVFPVSPAAS